MGAYNQGVIYLWGLISGAYNQVLISGGHISWGLISVSLYPGAYIRGASIQGAEDHTDNF